MSWRPSAMVAATVRASISCEIGAPTTKPKPALSSVFALSGKSAFSRAPPRSLASGLIAGAPFWALASRGRAWEPWRFCPPSFPLAIHAPPRERTAAEERRLRAFPKPSEPGSRGPPLATETNTVFFGRLARTISRPNPKHHGFLPRPLRRANANRTRAETKANKPSRPQTRRKPRSSLANPAARRPPFPSHALRGLRFFRPRLSNSPEWTAPKPSNRPLFHAPDRIHPPRTMRILFP